MAEPTLVQVFGTGATQTPTSITILKADLTGLTATANNTAESLYVGIQQRAATYLTSANRLLNPDQSVAIEAGFDSIAYRGSTAYYQAEFNTTLQKVNSAAIINLNDY